MTGGGCTGAVAMWAANGKIKQKYNITDERAVCPAAATTQIARTQFYTLQISRPTSGRQDDRKMERHCPHPQRHACPITQPPIHARVCSRKFIGLRGTERCESCFGDHTTAHTHRNIMMCNMHGRSRVFFACPSIC